jgi:hypothetical protein
MVSKPAISQARLREILNYDEATGVFAWRVRRGIGTPAGKVAGTVKPKGYIVIFIEGRCYFAHRLAFLYMQGVWPDDQVDHIDGNRANNAWANLRTATARENSWNAKRKRDNRVGLKGVSGAKNKFRASIYVDGKNRYLGLFATPEAAHAAHVEAARQLRGKFAWTGSAA